MGMLFPKPSHLELVAELDFLELNIPSLGFRSGGNTKGSFWEGRWRGNDGGEAALIKMYIGCLGGLLPSKGKNIEN